MFYVVDKILFHQKTVGDEASKSLEPEHKLFETEFDIPNEELENIVSSLIFESAPKLDVRDEIRQNKTS